MFITERKFGYHKVLFHLDLTFNFTYSRQSIQTVVLHGYITLVSTHV